MVSGTLEARDLRLVLAIAEAGGATRAAKQLHVSQSAVSHQLRGLEVERPKLRVATQCYTAYHWLPKALLALAAEHPEVELVLSSEVLGDPREAFAESRVDLALCVVPPRRGDFRRVPLFKDEMLL